MTDLNELRLRASVLSHYELPWLGAGDEGEALFADSTRVLVGDVRHWTLNDAVRRSIASRVPFADLHRAWRRLPHRPTDSRQRAIDRVIRAHGAVRLAEFGPAELRALAWLSRWLGDHLPMTEEINRAVELAGLLEPLHSLANESFVGRADLLTQLQSHWEKPGAPILLHGIGGIGKSATLARHVLRTVPTALVSYLNFDQASLDPAVPATVIGAMARQLVIQATGEDLDQLASGVRDLLRSGDKQFESSSRSSNIGATRTDLLNLVRNTLRGRRVLLVLDTFEEVQRRGSVVQESFTDLLLRLALATPTMSIVVAGRAPVPEFRNIEVPLLTSDEATWLLWSLLSFRITTAEAAQVVETVRPSPLCIRLAAGILQKHQTHDAFRDIELKLGTIEGELYHRLLGYIENPDVRKLAHPGLTLRRVTPQLIEQVLAKPCRVAVPDSATAHHLYEELAREAMLVDRTPDGLVHRKDVRQMMLPRLATDDSRTVTAIHRRAIAYYKDQPGPTARTEELYHRLMLGQKRSTLERYWDEAALPGLVSSIDELPPASKAYLATKSQYLGVSEEDLRAADLADRAELVLRRARKLFQERQFERALSAILSHQGDAGELPFALTDLLVQVLESLNRLDDALSLAEAGRDRAANSESPQDFYTLTLHVIRLNERLRRLPAAQEEAIKALQTTDSAPPTTDFQLVRLRLLAYSLRLAQRGARPAQYGWDELAREAVRLYHELGPRVVREVPGLLRDLAAEIGPREPKILRAALRSYGLDPRDAPEILRAFGAESPKFASELQSPNWDRYSLADFFANLMDVSLLPRPALEAIAEIYRQEADDAIIGSADSELVFVRATQPKKRVPVAAVINALLRERESDPHPRARLRLAEAYLAAGLADVSANVINDVLPDLRITKVGLDVAEAEHCLAVAEFLRGEFEQSEVHAGAAYRRFDRRGSENSAALAALAQLHARVAMAADGRRKPRQIFQEQAIHLAGSLAAHGQPDESLMARLLAARVAILRRELGEVKWLNDAMSLMGPGTPVNCRMLWRLCLAELAVARKVPQAALAEARLGFAELTSLPDRLGSLDLPTGTAVYGRALADLAVDIAVEVNDPELFDWVERAKAPVYHYDPRPRDQRMDPESVVCSRAEVAEQLGGRVLVSFGSSRGSLFAVVLNGRAVTVQLGSAGNAVKINAAQRLSWLEEHIVRPLLPLIGDRELVISPTGVLASIAWGALPSLRGRGITVAPSASSWLRAERTQVRDGTALTHIDALVENTPDNPWFSSIRLADGQLRAYEFAEVGQAPGIVVVSSGDLGFAGRLLEVGVRTVVIVPAQVTETALASAMTELYRLLSAGRSVSQAVAEVTARDPLRAPLVCVGAF